MFVYAEQPEAFNDRGRHRDWRWWRLGLCAKIPSGLDIHLDVAGIFRCRVDFTEWECESACTCNRGCWKSCFGVVVALCDFLCSSQLPLTSYDPVGIGCGYNARGPKAQQCKKFHLQGCQLMTSTRKRKLSIRNHPAEYACAHD